MSVPAVLRQSRHYKLRCTDTEELCKDQKLAKHVQGVVLCCPKNKRANPKQKTPYKTVQLRRTTRGQDPGAIFAEALQAIALL